MRKKSCFYQDNESKHEEIINELNQKRFNNLKKNFEYYFNPSYIQKQRDEIYKNYLYYLFRDADMSPSKNDYAENQKEIKSKNKKRIFNSKEKNNYISRDAYIYVMNEPKSYHDFLKGLMDSNSKYSNPNNISFDDLDNSILEYIVDELLYIKPKMNNLFQAERNQLQKAIKNKAKKEKYKCIVCFEKIKKNFKLNNESIKHHQKIKNHLYIESNNKKIKFEVKSSDNILLDNNQNKSLLSGEPETNNSFPDEQYPLLENKDKEFYKDYNEVIDNKFKLNIKRFKPSRKKKNSTKIGRRNKKIKLRVKSLPKFLLAKKDNYIKESANDDPEGKPNAHKKTNSEKKEGKNGGKKPGGERNSKNSTKIKEENNSFNDFELDILSSEFDKDFNELLSEKNYPCSLSEKDLFGHCPKERDKKYENSEEKKEGDSFDNFNIFNSKTSNKTYSMPNNPHLAFLEDSQNVSNLLNYSCKNFFRPSSDFFPSENLENFARFNSSNKNEGNDKEKKKKKKKNF